MMHLLKSLPKTHSIFLKTHKLWIIGVNLGCLVWMEILACFLYGLWGWEFGPIYDLDLRLLMDRTPFVLMPMTLRLG